MESGGFEPGKDPVDLFFLFDASASQNNKLNEMMESARNIVRMFSATKDNREKDICRVGSSLFLGPRIRMMCSHLLKTFEDQWWYYYSYTREYNLKPGYGIPKLGNTHTYDDRPIDKQTGKVLIPRG